MNCREIEKNNNRKREDRSLQILLMALPFFLPLFPSLLWRDRLELSFVEEVKLKQKGISLSNVNRRETILHCQTAIRHRFVTFPLSITVFIFVLFGVVKYVYFVSFPPNIFLIVLWPIELSLFNLYMLH